MGQRHAGGQADNDSVHGGDGDDMAQRGDGNDGMPDPQRDELLRLFPELALPGSCSAARMTLKGYETRVLLRA